MTVAPPIVDVVFGRRDTGLPWRVAAAIGTSALAVAIAVTASAVLGARPLEAATRIAEYEVDLRPPPRPPQVAPPLPAPPPNEPASEPTAAAPDVVPTRVAARPRPTSAPAQAASIVAAQPRPEGPVDFGGEFVVGSGSTYSGGFTSTSGTSRDAVPDRPRLAADPAAVPARRPPPPPPVLTRQIALADDDDWNCPWPSQAEDQDIDEQIVIVRVTVEQDGAVAAARLVRDPGSGFGAAALSCARRARFRPALDADGRPVRAVSPPIRIRFWR